MPEDQKILGSSTILMRKQANLPQAVVSLLSQLVGAETAKEERRKWK